MPRVVGCRHLTSTSFSISNESGNKITDFRRFRRASFGLLTCDRRRHPVGRLLFKQDFRRFTRRYASAAVTFLNRSNVFCPSLARGSLKNAFCNARRRVQNYDELSSTIIDRRCGLPLPVFWKNDDFPKCLNVDGFEERRFDVKDLPSLYLRLGKARLSALVVVTALGGFALCPYHAPLSLMNSSCWAPPLLALLTGTTLSAMGANAVNQCLEAPFDAQMKRTRNRALPTRQISPLHALTFGFMSGLTGCVILYCGANALTACLSALNFLLYTAVYTPMKRISIYNTWIGSVVGAIPPVMGWTACGAPLESGALVLGGILFAWQFPHFNALSWNLRSDYSQAGYRMMAASRPDLLRRTALSYSCWLIPLSSVCVPLSGLTSWTFAVTSLPLNVYFSYLAWRFYRETDSRNSKKLFRCSLIYLPTIILLMLISGVRRPSSPSDRQVDSNVARKI